MARILIVEDPLRPAAAIVVLGGGPPFRALEAADLYRAGWAPRIIVTGAVTWDLDVLLSAGIPRSDITLATGRPRDTFEELQLIAGLADVRDATVILVTSKVHTRRTKLLWRYVTGRPAAGIVRAARGDPFAVDEWLRRRGARDLVVHEYLSILNYYLDFPASRFDRAVRHP